MDGEIKPGEREQASVGVGVEFESTKSTETTDGGEVALLVVGGAIGWIY